jgi:hypothetical protein
MRRVAEHGAYVFSRNGNEDLSGGAARLQVALALASREIVTPRIAPDGDAVGVGLRSSSRGVMGQVADAGDDSGCVAGYWSARLRGP